VAGGAAVRSSNAGDDNTPESLDKATLVPVRRSTPDSPEMDLSSGRGAGVTPPLPSDPRGLAAPGGRGDGDSNPSEDSNPGKGSGFPGGGNGAPREVPERRGPESGPPGAAAGPKVTPQELMGFGFARRRALPSNSYIYICCWLYGALTKVFHAQARGTLLIRTRALTLRNEQMYVVTICTYMS
jgi:hypothetical protein